MIPPLFAGLVDDAAMFPPGDLPVDEAVPAHARHHQSWYGGVVGTFVCADTRLDEIAGPVRVSVVATGGPDTVGEVVGRVRARPELTLAGVEVPGLPKVPAGVPLYAEVPLAELDAVARNGLRAKLRTGGLTAAAFPSEAAVAAYVAGCVDRKVAFKCTAGLHHAVRHRAVDTGFEHHGFLNILLAVDGALRGQSTADLLGILAERDEEAVAHAVRGIADVEPVRALFTSFGSCSVTDPVDDLVRLGLLVPGGIA